MDNAIRLGPPHRDDAAALLKIHGAAVHRTAAPFYPPEIIQNWSRLSISPQRVAWVQEHWIEDPALTVIVARTGDRPVGFGFIHQANELQALYVHPDFGRRGIGSRLIAALIQAARQQGMPYLTAHASLNAAAFYQRNGFDVLGPGTFRLNSGYTMDCVKIRKTLADPNESSSVA